MTLRDLVEARCGPPVRWTEREMPVYVCPWCGESSLIVNEARGLYQCFNPDCQDQIGGPAGGDATLWRLKIADLG